MGPTRKKLLLLRLAVHHFENPTIERSPRQCLARLDGQRQIARIDKHVRIVEFRNDTNHGHVL